MNQRIKDLNFATYQEVVITNKTNCLKSKPYDTDKDFCMFNIFNGRSYFSSKSVRP
jgi:hypothetical protein